MNTLRRWIFNGLISFLKLGENKYIGYQLILAHEFFVISYFKKPFNLIISFIIWFGILLLGAAKVDLRYRI